MITLPPLHTFDVPLALQLARIREQLNTHREPAGPSRDLDARARAVVVAERQDAMKSRVRLWTVEHAATIREQRRAAKARKAEMFVQWALRKQARRESN